EHQPYEGTGPHSESIGRAARSEAWDERGAALEVLAELGEGFGGGDDVEDGPGDELGGVEDGAVAGGGDGVSGEGGLVVDGGKGVDGHQGVDGGDHFAHVAHVGGAGLGGHGLAREGGAADSVEVGLVDGGQGRVGPDGIVVVGG